MTKRLFAAILCVILLSLTACATQKSNDTGVEPPDYDDGANWAYFSMGEDKAVDVFLICPTVDTKSETNSFDLNEKLKGRFISALDLEKGIYEESGRLYSPFYRQMSTNVYKMTGPDRELAEKIAYQNAVHQSAELEDGRHRRGQIAQQGRRDVGRC